MKTLIGIASCHGPEYRAKADAQRQTCLRDVKGADVKFFVGEGPQSHNPEVQLSCPDDYDHRLEKALAIFDFALTNNYTYLWRADDDCYLRPERLLAIPQRDFQGHWMKHKTFQSVGTILGACFGISARAMRLVLKAPLPPFHHRYEDVFLSLTLLSHGIEPFDLKPVIVWTHKRGNEFAMNWQRPPHPTNNVAASFEYGPQQLFNLHRAWECAK